VDWSIDASAIEVGLTKGINIIYDPTLTRALYPKPNSAVSLFNLETNQEIAQLSIPGQTRLPKWSPDGKNLAVIGTKSYSAENILLDEFWVISRDGLDRKELSFPPSSFKKVHIEDYSWSPNDSQIAFWLTTDNNKSTTAQNPFELAVLDLDRNEITNYCISGTSTIDYATYTDPVNIIWSPDGTQLLIVRYNNDNNKNTDEIIVDLKNKSAYKVAENMQPIGWMTIER
jgi:Tol biopolymer transport system component